MIIWGQHISYFFIFVVLDDKINCVCNWLPVPFEGHRQNMCGARLASFVYNECYNRESDLVANLMLILMCQVICEFDCH